MIVVLVVLGLMVGLVVARGPQRSPTLDLSAAASEVAQALRVARSQAIATDRPVSVRIDVAAHSYAVGAAAPRTLPAALGIKLVSVAGEAAGTSGAIRFSPDGSSSGGSVDLALGARHAHVGVNWLTGRVTLGEDAGGEASAPSG
jgi:general secretion pathway protein H